MDNRTFRRLIYQVLDHDPTHEDIRRFFQRFKAILDACGLILYGITTDASPLYPTPITDVFGDVKHQVCEFHTIAELTKAVLRAVAKVRKTLAAGLPQLPRGRPSKATRKSARQRKRTQKRIADLFEHRHLFVQHHLTAVEKRTLQRITRGLPQLRALREIMTEVYRLFDRRCCTHTALGKLARLRRRVRRFKKVGRTLQKLFSPNLEKALTFLNDSLLPSTSNAVERGYRRHRKMQKTVYRVRGHEHIVHRIALDMQREAQTPARERATATLHLQRTGSKGQGIYSVLMLQSPDGDFLLFRQSRDLLEGLDAVLRTLLVGDAVAVPGKRDDVRVPGCRRGVDRFAQLRQTLRVILAMIQSLCERVAPCHRADESVLPQRPPLVGPEQVNPLDSEALENGSGLLQFEPAERAHRDRLLDPASTCGSGSVCACWTQATETCGRENQSFASRAASGMYWISHTHSYTGVPGSGGCSALLTLPPNTSTASAISATCAGS